MNEEREENMVCECGHKLKYHIESMQCQECKCRFYREFKDKLGDY